jgi:DNA-binding IclR family transcriptional regulator
VLPLTGSASGRAILAFTPDRIRQKLIKLQASNHEEDSPAKLAERFDRIRKRGYDIADSTVVPGLSAISAPILDLQNEAVASVTLVGARADISKAGSQLIGHLLETSAKVSRACGSTLSFN